MDLQKRSEMVVEILRSYYNSVLDTVTEEPSSYTDMPFAHKDPKAVAKAYTLQFKKLLSYKSDTDIIILYNQILDEEDGENVDTISKESKD